MEKGSKELIDEKVLPIPMIGKELARFEGDTFYLAEHECAVVYHVYNSMTLIVRPNQTSTYELLLDIIHNHKEYENMDGEERESFDITISAITYLLNVPLYAFGDIKFTYNLAAYVIEKLREQLQKSLDEPVQDETFNENREFENAVLAIEDLKENVDETPKPKSMPMRRRVRKEEE